MSLSRKFGGPCACRAAFAYFVPVAGLPEEPDSSRAQRSDTQLAPDEGRHLSPEDFYGVQRFFVWQCRNTHLERNAGDASKNFVHVKDLFRDRFSVAD